MNTNPLVMPFLARPENVSTNISAGEGRLSQLLEAEITTMAMQEVPTVWIGPSNGILRTFFHIKKTSSRKIHKSVKVGYCMVKLQHICLFCVIFCGLTCVEFFGNRLQYSKPGSKHVVARRDGPWQRASILAGASK